MLGRNIWMQYMVELSVILPVNNAILFLPAAINSILVQSFSNFNLIIIDNGSTDGSAAYINSLDDNRIKYFYLEEKNFVKALNLGLSKVDTPFIARMDADDTCHSSRFEEQINFLNKNQDVGLVGTNGQYFGNKKNRFINIHLPVTHQDIVDTMRNSRHAVIHASIMFRKSILEDVDHYDEKYFPCEDFELFLLGLYEDLDESDFLLEREEERVLFSLIWDLLPEDL